ncbi:MAG TPA: A/G-specific adenine glycosylase [Kiritimatiellia bacterium]|nr:A/G-specific adenine glycosylase [Kiritimatiellia bacterium]HRU71770.1 A/G-specific adenine glycosylase [Kiritimatiellia bacterium]
MTAIDRRLLEWYDANRREMPWRDHPDPYAVWVSEIMLQQTQVETVRGYFERFLQALPTVAALAAAPQQQVLKLWEGLGYYTRARNLQRAAQQIALQGGKLPRDVAGWRALPGVGPYTAAAIASICFGVAAPVVDGNVIRVFARYLGWDDDFRKPPARARLAAWLQPHIAASGRPGDFNQAMMDLGAVLCMPRAPDCGGCPLHGGCVARREGRQAVLPARPARKAVPTRTAVAVLARDAAGRVLLTQRTSDGLLSGLWELPNFASDDSPAARHAARVLREIAGLRAARMEAQGCFTHVFTHFKQVWHLFEASGLEKIAAKRQHPLSARFVIPNEIPLTTLTHRVLNHVCGRPACNNVSAKS